jgi:hypothetical protein
MNNTYINKLTYGNVPAGKDGGTNTHQDGKNPVVPVSKTGQKIC